MHRMFAVNPCATGFFQIRRDLNKTRLTFRAENDERKLLACYEGSI